MPARSLILGSFLLVIAMLRAAAADVPGGDPTTRQPDEVRALQDEIAQDDQKLSTGDCAVACQALGSMQHAADRLCELAPGPLCAEARSKVKNATDRVRASCPECGAAGNEVPPIAAGARDFEKPEVGQEVVAAAPRRGGCAGCTVGGERGGAAGALALVLAWAIARWRRRGRRSP